jgi:hypothetical protein
VLQVPSLLEVYFKASSSVATHLGAAERGKRIWQEGWRATPPQSPEVVVSGRRNQEVQETEDGAPKGALNGADSMLDVLRRGTPLAACKLTEQLTHV